MLFKEEQTFSKWKVGLILLIAVSGIIIALLTQEETTKTTYYTLVGIFILMSVMSVLIFKSKLETSIDRFAIKYRFFPFISSWKRIEREQIKTVEVIKYSPIGDYGGYGYRLSFRNGRALNVGGNMGLKIIDHQDKKLLIGTQKPVELEQALTKFLAEKPE